MPQTIGNETGKGISKNWGYELERSSRNLFHNKKKKASGFIHEDVVTGSKESLLELNMRLESVYPINTNIIGTGSAKSIKALNRRIRWGEWEHSGKSNS